MRNGRQIITASAAERERAENVRARADAAVDEDLHAIPHRVRDLGQDVRSRGTAGQHAPTVVRDDDGRRAGLHSLLRAAHRHDTLEDHGHLRIAAQFAQLRDRLAAGVGAGRLQVRQARRGGHSEHAGGHVAGAVWPDIFPARDRGAHRLFSPAHLNRKRARAPEKVSLGA